jgi:hypothetical protein
MGRLLGGATKHQIRNLECGRERSLLMVMRSAESSETPSVNQPDSAVLA